MKGQTLLVYRWLQDGGTVTDMEALRMWGIRRLAARIHEIREVADVRATTEKANGKRWARYELVKPAEPQLSFFAKESRDETHMPHAGANQP